MTPSPPTTSTADLSRSPVEPPVPRRKVGMVRALLVHSRRPARLLLGLLVSIVVVGGPTLGAVYAIQHYFWAQVAGLVAFSLLGVLVGQAVWCDDVRPWLRRVREAASQDLDE